MTRAEVEYVGGPADGRRESVRVGPNGTPPTWLAYAAGELWGSALDSAPLAPASVHRYERDPGYAPGLPWRYLHRGPFV